MSCEIDFKSNIYLSGQDLKDNIFLVECKISDLDIYINNIRTKINMFASSNSRDIIPDTWDEEPIRWINKEVDELIDDLHENIVLKYQLNLYKEYLEYKQNDNK